MQGKLIFITGASRSGTTLLSFVLRNHSAIFGLKELNYFGVQFALDRLESAQPQARLVAAAASIFARQRDGVFTAGAEGQDFDDAERVVAALPESARTGAGVFAATVGVLARRAGKRIPCEQTPRNIFYAQTLLSVFPEARVIHMMRDPRAVMASQKWRWRRRQLVADSRRFPVIESLRVWMNYHPYTMAKLWAKASAEAARMEEHPRFRVLRFEDLVGRPETAVAELSDWLGLPFEPSMLDVNRINSSYGAGAGASDGRSGLEPSAISRWRGNLSSSEIAIAERLTAPLLDRYDYVPETDARGSGQLAEWWHRLTYPWHAAGVLLVNPRRAWIQMRASARGRVLTG
ncbi:MAG: sulfotransferase [Woeseia sp.]